MFTKRLAFLVLLVFCSGSVAVDSLQEALQEAENMFRFQDYRGTSVVLRPLLYPEVQIENPDQLHRARELLGASLFFLQDEQGMEDEFTALLVQQPQYELDAFYYPSELLERFEELRKHLTTLQIIVPETPGVSLAEPICQHTQETVLRRSWWPQFMPFGVGQFHNRQWGKGAAFAGTQLIALGTNIGAYIGAEKLRGADGFYSPSDAALARNLRVVQYASIGVFAGLVLWGVLDAVFSFTPEERVIQILPCTSPVQGDIGMAAKTVGLCLQY